jgi:GAF domain-containing protein
MIGWASAHQQARIALDVGKEPVRFANPLLPETHSEIALPLFAGEHVLGALSVQSAQVAAFDESDVALLQGMADQIAIALENARLFQQTQAALKELEATNRLLVREGWQNYIQRPSAARRAVYQAPDAPADEPATKPLSIPLEVRGQPLGRLILRRAGGRAWSEDETELIRAIVLQAMLAADNARLFEDAQRTAARERLIGEVTTRIRSAATMEAVLNSAIREVSQLTGASYAAIKLELADTA